MKSDVLSVEGIIESGYRKVRKNGTVKFRHAMWKDERFLVGETVFCRFQGREALHSGPVEFWDDTGYKRICLLDEPV